MTELRSYMPSISVVQYKPTDDELKKYKDGGVAIIDQWICAHARWVKEIDSQILSVELERHRM